MASAERPITVLSAASGRVVVGLQPVLSAASGGVVVGLQPVLSAASGGVVFGFQPVLPAAGAALRIVTAARRGGRTGQVTGSSRVTEL
jgi:hypothetical protein